MDEKDMGKVCNPDGDNVSSNNEAKLDESEPNHQVTKDLPYSLYICPYNTSKDIPIVNKLSKSDLERVVKSFKPCGQWLVTETSCGLLVYFSHQSDRITLMECELHKELKCPLQVAKFTNYDMKSGYSVIIKDIPWSIPSQEIFKALDNQGIKPVHVERVHQTLKVEVSDVSQYENLLRNGLDFFGASRFPALGSKWQSLLFQHSWNNRPVDKHESVLQCFRCQGFWHVARNCDQPPCCVRCGGDHTVEFCLKPRNRPTCCHCGGPHHAAYFNCPVQQALKDSTPVSLTISTSLRKNRN